MDQNMIKANANSWNLIILLASSKHTSQDSFDLKNKRCWKVIRLRVYLRLSTLNICHCNCGRPLPFACNALNHLICHNVSSLWLSLDPGPEQQWLDATAGLPGVSDHQSRQHGTQRGQETHWRTEETLRCGWWAAFQMVTEVFVTEVNTTKWMPLLAGCMSCISASAEV